ncbi:MAG: alginate lyase family protein [Ferruginibacter sp.]
MKKYKLLIAFFMMSYLAAHAQPAVFSINAKALEKNKKRIAKRDVSVKLAYEKLLSDADKAMEFDAVSVMEKKNNPPSGDKHDYMSLAPYFWPNPATKDGLPYIRKDGETNPEVKDYKDKEYMPKLCEVVNTLGLAYYFSGDNKYAEHAGKLLRVWFLDPATKMNPNLNYAQAIKGTNDGRGAGLIDSRHFIKLIDGIGLLNGSKDWTADNQAGMKQWFAAYLNWLQTSKNGMDEMHAKNNHGDWYDAQRLSMALFTGDTELAKKIVLNAESRLDKQMDSAGFFPLEMERTTSLHYSVFAIEAFINIAQMAEQVDINFWKYTSSSGHSLKRAFDIMYPYLTEEKEWTGPQIKKYEREESILLLAAGKKKFGCNRCTGIMNSIIGDGYYSLRTRLLTDIDF